MSGICSYLPTQGLSDWCAGIDITGVRAGIALSIVVIFALTKFQGQVALQERQVQPLQGRVQGDEKLRLLQGTEKLSAFLKEAFGDPVAKKVIADGFIRNPLDVLGRLYPESQANQLWAFLLRATCSTAISQQFDVEVVEAPSSDGVQIREPAKDVVIDFMDLSEKLNKGPLSWKYKFKKLGEAGQEIIVKGFLNEVEKLAECLDDLYEQDFDEAAGRTFGGDLAVDLRDFLMKPAIVKPAAVASIDDANDKGKDEALVAPIADGAQVEEEGPQRLGMIPVEN